MTSLESSWNFNIITPFALSSGVHATTRSSRLKSSYQTGEISATNLFVSFYSDRIRLTVGMFGRGCGYQAGQSKRLSRAVVVARHWGRRRGLREAGQTPIPRLAPLHANVLVEHCLERPRRPSLLDGEAGNQGYQGAYRLKALSSLRRGSP